MSDFTSKLIKAFEENEATKGIITEEKASVLEALSSHMLEVNEHLNLTAIKDEDGVILKHLVDSSACVPYIAKNAWSARTLSEFTWNVPETPLLVCKSA